MTRFGFVPDSSQSMPSGSTKSTLPQKSTPTYGNSSIKVKFLLHQAKKSTVNLNSESFPNIRDKLVHISIRGSVVSCAIDAICGYIWGIHSKKNETKKEP
jgi:hypothetical protein